MFTPDTQRLPHVVQPPGAWPECSADLACDDWGVLLDAVKARLSLGVARVTRGPPGVPTSPTGLPLTVLECVSALDHLQRTWAAACQPSPPFALDHFDRCQAPGCTGRSAPDAAANPALHDPLTGLPDQALFTTRLDRLARTSGDVGQTLVLFCLDVDGFDELGDQHGASATGEMLKILAARLRRAVRSDDLVGRLDGGAFALAVHGTLNRAHTSHLACKWFDAASAPVRIGALTLTLRPSIGIALYPADGGEAQGLLGQAADAAATARCSGTGYAFHDECASAWLRPTAGPGRESAEATGRCAPAAQPTAGIAG